MKMLALAIAVIAAITINHVMAQSQNGTAGFIANPKNNNTVIGTADPNYNTFQNLALGFSIKYLKNMTISEKINNTQHFVTFKTPSGKPFREGLVLAISVILENNFLGQQYSLDKTVRDVLAADVGNNVTVTSKIQGMLNGFPAYKIEVMALIPKSFKNITSSLGYDGMPIKYEYRTVYVSFKDGIGYWITFFTYSTDRFNPIEKTMIDSFRYN